jgi:biotin synthase
MGNFLTTLGSSPAEDRAMFTDLGLNVAAQPDNGARPRPDNRSGWLEGETPDVVGEHVTRASAAGGAGGSGGAAIAGGSGDAARLEVRLWDPARQLRHVRKPKVPPRPDGAPNAWPKRAA